MGIRFRYTNEVSAKRFEYVETLFLEEIRHNPDKD